MDCTAYDDLRRSIWSSDNPGNGIPSTVAAFLTDMKHVRKTARYVLQTGLISYLNNSAELDSQSTSDNQLPSGPTG